jgi:LacI family transcriptional regulator
MSSKISDIAKLAGVSTATVSRVINNTGKVTIKTRQKVETVVKQLGYKPNYFAQVLMRKHTDSVGLLVTSYTNPYHTETIDTIGQVLSQNGIYIYICNCKDSFELEKEYTQELIRRNIDALIVFETPSISTINNGCGNYFLNTQFDCPVILINQHIKPYGDNYIIRCDQKPGIMEVLNRVQARQLFPFLFFTFYTEDGYSYLYKEKLINAWKRKNRLSDQDAGICKIRNLPSANNVEAVWQTREVAKKVLRSIRPRSIFASNDLMATGVLAAARELSIRVPEELSLVGVDNTYLSRISTPTLSSIDLRMKDVGTMAAELYLNLKRNPEKEQPKIHVIPSRLFSRASF